MEETQEENVTCSLPLYQTLGVHPAAVSAGLIDVSCPDLFH